MTNYRDTLTQIGALTRTVASAARRLSWNLARTTPDAITRTVAARQQRLMAESEAYRRNRSEHAHVTAEIRAEEVAARSLSASAARFRLEPHVRALDQLYASFVATCRADTGLSFQHALDHVDANGMLVAALLREQLRPAIEAADAAGLLDRYTRALASQDAAGLIVAELIEARSARGGLATTTEHLPIVARLRDVIDGVMELRVPIEELADVPQTIAFGRKAVSMADLARCGRSIRTIRRIRRSPPRSPPRRRSIRPPSTSSARRLRRRRRDRMTPRLLVFPGEFDTCLRSASPPPFDAGRCFLIAGASGPYIPPGDSDACCAACVGWDWFRAARAEDAANGIHLDIRSYRALVLDNAFTRRVAARVQRRTWTSEL